MEPTLKTGDIILTDHISPRFGRLSRGDIIVARSPRKPKEHICKRVVAVGGDVLACNRINGTISAVSIQTHKKNYLASWQVFGHEYRCLWYLEDIFGLRETIQQTPLIHEIMVLFPLDLLKEECFLEYGHLYQDLTEHLPRKQKQSFVIITKSEIWRGDKTSKRVSLNPNVVVRGNLWFELVISNSKRKYSNSLPVFILVQSYVFFKVFIFIYCVTMTGIVTPKPTFRQSYCIPGCEAIEGSRKFNFINLF